MNSVVSTIVRDIDTVEIFGLTLDEQQINAATAVKNKTTNKIPINCFE